MLRYSRLAGTALAVIALGVSMPRAGADELSRSDKLRVLYSNQFAFDRRGVPLITIGIAQGASEVVIESGAPLRALPDGEDGAEVLAGRGWQVSLKRSRPAVVEHFVELARAPASALDRIRPQLARWRGRRTRARMVEVGTIFGVKGKVFDNRSYVLTDGPYRTEEAARGAAERYQKKGWLQRVAVLQQLKRRPSGQLIAAAADGKARIQLRDAIWFAPSAGQTLRVRADGRTVSSSPSSYWGQVYVTVDSAGKLAVVNAVPADRLLAGLVPAEIFPSAPHAALAAQAVAARGDLLAKIGTRHFVDPYLICSWQHCQVYRGAGHEHPRTTKAVDATKGLVLVKNDGSLVKTVYSASCGGHTEHNDKVWAVSPDENLRGHLDSDDPALARFRGGIDERNIQAWLSTAGRTWCARSSYNREKYRWTVRLPGAKLDRLVADLGVGSVRGIRVVERGRSGRAYEIELEGTRGSKRINGELRIRRALGNLRSSMFVVERVADGRGGAAFVFSGGGWGHGVGMCQTGAAGMAQAGKRYQQILQHYYPGSSLQALYER